MTGTGSLRLAYQTANPIGGRSANLGDSEEGEHYAANTAPIGSADYQTLKRIWPFSESSPMATESDLRASEIAAAEARTDTKIARMEGKIDTLTAMLSGKLDKIDSDLSRSRGEAQENKRAVLITIVGSAFALLGISLAVMTYGDAIFSRGMSVRDVVNAVVQEQSKKPAQQ